MELLLSGAGRERAHDGSLQVDGLLRARLGVGVGKGIRVGTMPKLRHNAKDLDRMPRFSRHNAKT